MSHTFFRPRAAGLILIFVIKIIAYAGSDIAQLAPNIVRAVPPPGRVDDIVRTVRQGVDDLDVDSTSGFRVMSDVGPDIVTGAMDMMDPDAPSDDD